LAGQLAVPASARFLELPRISPLRGTLLHIKRNVVLKASDPEKGASTFIREGALKDFELSDWLNARVRSKFNIDRHF
jgi:hypothetical protein